VLSASDGGSSASDGGSPAKDGGSSADEGVPSASGGELSASGGELSASGGEPSPKDGVPPAHLTSKWHPRQTGGQTLHKRAGLVYTGDMFTCFLPYADRVGSDSLKNAGRLGVAACGQQAIAQYTTRKGVGVAEDRAEGEPTGARAGARGSRVEKSRAHGGLPSLLSMAVLPLLTMPTSLVAGRALKDRTKAAAYCVILAGFLAFCAASCASQTASAEEYYTIGMAYYNIGKFDEAEKWLERARNADRTMTASEYQLGRIAFENKRYSEAAKHFEGILKKDKQNVLALEAAAYTHVKMGDHERALQYYREVLAIVPENADDGYNYALLLYAAKEYAEAEAVLVKYEYNLPGNKDAQLLLSRVQAAAEKPEAIDSYALYLADNTDAVARCEFARVLGKNEFYARAIEEYKGALEDLTKETETLKKADIRFEIARLMFIADSGGEAALTELQGAITDGFTDTAKINELLGDSRLSAETKDSIKTVASAIRKPDTEDASKTESETKAEGESGTK
jgi:tetratricopeptide (TPR) repeat protein